MDTHYSTVPFPLRVFFFFLPPPPFWPLQPRTWGCQIISGRMEELSLTSVGAFISSNQLWETAPLYRYLTLTLWSIRHSLTHKTYAPARRFTCQQRPHIWTNTCWYQIEVIKQGDTWCHFLRSGNIKLRNQEKGTEDHGTTGPSQREEEAWTVTCTQRYHLNNCGKQMSLSDSKEHKPQRCYTSTTNTSCVTQKHTETTKLIFRQGLQKHGSVFSAFCKVQAGGESDLRHHADNNKHAVSDVKKRFSQIRVQSDPGLVWHMTWICFS